MSRDGSNQGDGGDGSARSVVELFVPPRTDYLALTRIVVSAVAVITRSVPEERLDDLRLVVSEACANAIAAHRAVGSDEDIAVVCHLGEQSITVEIADRGGGFRLADLVQMPPIADPARLEHEGGFGIPLMQRLADRAEFESTATGTSVRLHLNSA